MKVEVGKTYKFKLKGNDIHVNAVNGSSIFFENNVGMGIRIILGAIREKDIYFTGKVINIIHYSGYSVIILEDINKA
jgi:hypothetical protein